MKIFLSHSSRQKPLIREIKRCFPPHLHGWLDENEIVIGDSIDRSLKNAIQSDTDFLILFIDNSSVVSNWVESEVTWALEQEKKQNRIIILPVVIDQEAWDSFEFEELKSRKFLKCHNFNESTIRGVASELIAELFAILSREIEKVRHASSGESSFRLLDDADSFMRDVSNKIRSEAFGYRSGNPMEIIELQEKLSDIDIISSLNEDQFVDLMIRLVNHGYLSGFVFDGQQIYVKEEHFSWKTEMFSKAKKRIANKALSYIENNSIIALDSGSTTLEVARSISQRIKLQMLSGIKVVTNSIAAAQVLVETISNLGLDENNDLLNVYLIGGKVRPNTMAVVDVSNTEEFNLGFLALFEVIGLPNIGFVGVNGVDESVGFTTHNNPELAVKKVILEKSKSVFLLADDSKFGIKEEFTFCQFDEAISVISNKSPITLKFDKVFKGQKAKLLLV